MVGQHGQLPYYDMRSCQEDSGREQHREQSEGDQADTIKHHGSEFPFVF